MSKEKDSFVFYRDWYLAVTTCDESTQLKLYRAIMEYVFLDLQPQDPTIQLAFSIIQQRLDADRQKWEGIKEKRKAAGRRGNEKRWGSKSETKVASVANANKSEQMIASVAVNDNVNVDNDTNVSMLSDNIKPTNVGTLQSHDSNLPQVRYNGLVEYWNKLVADKVMAKITDIKDGTIRRKLVAARIKEYGKEKFAECLRKAAASSFLNGDNGRSFIASFDWIIKPNNFPKVLEGNYDTVNNNSNGTVRTDNTAEQRRDAVAERVRQLLQEDGNL